MCVSEGSQDRHEQGSSRLMYAVHGGKGGSCSPVGRRPGPAPEWRAPVRTCPNINQVPAKGNVYTSQ